MAVTDMVQVLAGNELVDVLGSQLVHDPANGCLIKPEHETASINDTSASQSFEVIDGPQCFLIKKNGFVKQAVSQTVT